MSDIENGIRWSVCAEGHLYVDVLDPKDHVVAQFTLDGDAAEALAVGIIDEIGRWRQFVGDTIETVEGHA